MAERAIERVDHQAEDQRPRPSASITGPSSWRRGRRAPRRGHRPVARGRTSGRAGAEHVGEAALPAVALAPQHPQWAGTSVQATGSGMKSTGRARLLVGMPAQARASPMSSPTVSSRYPPMAITGSRRKSPKAPEMIRFPPGGSTPAGRRGRRAGTRRPGTRAGPGGARAGRPPARPRPRRRSRPGWCPRRHALVVQEERADHAEQGVGLDHRVGVDGATRSPVAR